MRLINLSWMLSLSLLVSACASQEIPEFNLAITRPANQDGMSVDVITGAYTIIPAEEWKIRSRKAILIERHDWEIVKKKLYSNCIEHSCKQSLDLISGFFEEIDKAVGVINPLPK